MEEEEEEEEEGREERKLQNVFHLAGLEEFIGG